MSVTGVSPGKHGIAIHKFGDFTRDWESCGPFFEGGEGQKRPIGDLGNIFVDERFGFPSYLSANLPIELTCLI